MNANSFGSIFSVTSFGESHGAGLGAVIQGCPAGVMFDMDLLQFNLNRRRPGQSGVVSSRNESDTAEVISGVFENKTLGTPICILIKNRDQKSSDYELIKDIPRIGHADDTWKEKFGHLDHRGGGRSSGRETAARVMAGSVAQMLCRQLNPELKLTGFASQIANFKLSDFEIKKAPDCNIDEFTTRFPSTENQARVVQLLEDAVKNGESYGGTVDIVVQNVPAGLGQPVFHKFKSDLAAAMMSVGATTAFEFGDGFESTEKKGSEFHSSHQSDVYGGIRGGITTGEAIRFSVGFKPTSSIKDIAKKGRHDPCIVTRAVPVLESMAWLVLADHLLWSRLDRV